MLGYFISDLLTDSDVLTVSLLSLDYLSVEIRIVIDVIENPLPDSLYFKDEIFSTTKR